MKILSLKLAIVLAYVGLIYLTPASAQELPAEIRGYKVHNAKITVTNQTGDRDKEDDSEAFARVSDPDLVGTSLTGLTFEITAAIDPIPYKGKVDFLSFKDFKVNGLNVTIDDFTQSFEFKKNTAVSLPRPVSIFLPAGQAIRGALGEIRDSRAEWTVTGTVFVFGRFKKWGFSVKRVVPVKVDVRIKNPIRDRVTLPIPVAN